MWFRPVALAVLLMLPGCFGEDSNLTESGKGRPLVSVEFPERAERGSTQTARLSIDNPGPGDIPTVVVTFARLGLIPQGETELPVPIVDFVLKGENSAIESIDPEPKAVSSDGVVFTFGPLAEGDSTTIAFELKMPERGEFAGNSVQVYSGDEIERARGVRLLTELGG